MSWDDFLLKPDGADNDLLRTGSVSEAFEEDLAVSPGGSCVRKLGREPSVGWPSGSCELSKCGSMATKYVDWSGPPQRDLANARQHYCLVQARWNEIL